MFKCIEIYKDYEKVATQHFTEGVAIVPKEGEYVRIRGMAIAYRVERIVFDYWSDTIIISVK